MIRTPVAAMAVRLCAPGASGYGATMSRAVPSLLASLAAHAAVVAAMCGVWRAAPGSATGMAIEALAFDEPAMLPAVAALPLPDAPAQFAPIAFRPGPAQPIAHAEPVGDHRPSPSPVAGAPKPGRATTVFFGVPAAGRSVVFVIDRSASMGLAGRLDRAVRETAASLRQLSADVRFAVIAYDRTAEPLGRGGLVLAKPSAIEAALVELSQLTAQGGTDHRRALRAALALGPDVIYFLTDEDELSPADVVAVTAANRGRTAIHAVCLSNPAGRTALAELAHRNGGTFHAVGD